PGTPVPAAPMDSAPPWAHSAKCRGCSVWSHFGASKLTLSLGPGSGSWNHRLPVGRHRRRLRIRVAVSAARDDHRRNRMLEDELLLVAGLQHHRVLVERSDAACQLHPTHQIDRDVVPFLSCRVEEGILNVLLCRLGFHLPISFFMFRCCAIELEGGQLAAALLSALTIRPCLALFNFPPKYIRCRVPARGAPSGPFPDFVTNRLSFIFLASHLQSSLPEQRIGALTLTEINFPTDLHTNIWMLVRWLHFVGGITWLGLLYFFNLVNVPFMKGLDPATKGKVLP